MRKVDQNKKQKKDSLLDAAFGLFMENGFHKTSISDIVNQAGVAKGTFYLYFTDKYDLRNKLISHKAIQVFSNAYNALLNTEIKTFEEQIIFIIDHILTQFQEDHSLVFFISKHLSWALFKNSLIDVPEEGQESIYDEYCQLLEKSGLHFKNPEIMIYMIIELISGTSYNSILYDQPKPINELKPYLYDTVRCIIQQNLLPDNGTGREVPAEEVCPFRAFSPVPNRFQPGSFQENQTKPGYARRGRRSVRPPSRLQTQLKYKKEQTSLSEEVCSFFFPYSFQKNHGGSAG